MFVAVDRDTPFLSQAGAYSVGAFAGLAPVRAGPQAPFPEGCQVGILAALIQDHTVAIGQKNTAP
ncbi:hypothetical protein D3C87_2124890 [compost metagenome]